MIRRAVALFGEAEKGNCGIPFFMKSLTHLSETFGNPPQESRGIFLAIQFLLSEKPVLYIRVEEEGFSPHDYAKGVKHILNKKHLLHIEAVCSPGAGDAHIVDFLEPIIKKWNAIFITTEQDLYDYLTSFCRVNR